MTRELVIAIYKENISWLNKRSFKDEKISAYNKWTRFDYPYIRQLKNVGRESHTYIFHIIENYKNLCDYTTFVQGYPFDHLYDLADNLNIDIFNFKSFPIHDYHPLGELRPCDQLGRPFSHWDVDLKVIWNELFEDPMPYNFFATYGAQFIVSRRLIENRSILFWKKALDLHYKFDFAPWAYEILWYHIFDPRYKALL